MHKLIAFTAVLSLLAAGPAFAAVSPAQAAVAALVAHERAVGNSDVEQPSCYILQAYAQCQFGTGHGNANVVAWLHLKNAKWTFLGSGGGVTFASQLESQYGIPASIAKQFQAKQ
jgi:hypothetical protein